MTLMAQRRTDGRALRAAHGRSRVSTALVELVEEHGRMPTVSEVAARAGVGRRSVFRYFDGVGALELETARAMRELMVRRVRIPGASGSLEQRLRALVRHRARLYERITPVRRFLDAARYRGRPDVDAFIDDGRARLRQHLKLILAPELAGRPQLLPVLETLTSWEAWTALREGRGESAARASRVVHEGLAALLSSSPRGR